AARLESDFIEAELERLRTEPAAAVLMYQHGINLMAERRLEEASSYFRRFLDNYPEHSLAGRAKEQMVTMTSAAFFQRGTIGCVLPLSGRYEKIGRQALRGMELALSEASDGREDQGIPLRVLIRDSKSDPETARKAVEELAGRHVAAIAGPIETAPQAAQAAQDQRLPIIVMSQRDTVAETGEYVFNNFITPQMQVDAVTRYAMGRLGCRNFAVLFPDEGYGRTYLDLFGRRLAEEKARLVGAEPYNPEHTDFAGPIKKLAGLYYGLPADIESQRLQGERLETMAESAGLHGKLFGQNILPWMQPTGADAGERYGYGELMIDKPAPRVNFEAVFIPDSPEKAGLIIPQLRYYDINNAFLLGTNLWHSQKLIDIAGDHAGKAVIPEGFFAESRRPGVREFVDKFEKVYGYEPGFLEAVGYDTAMILFEQISDETVFNRPALGRALSEMPAYRGLTGRTGFTATGTADKSLYLLTVSRGRFVEITE
ncbi:MAG: penicillin-binding protein activator, partial [Desulfosalsimonas sp.]